MLDTLTHPHELTTSGAIRWAETQKHLPQWAPQYLRGDQYSRPRKWNSNEQGYTGNYRIIEIGFDAILWSADGQTPVLAYTAFHDGYDWVYRIKPAEGFMAALQSIHQFSNSHSGLKAFERLLKQLRWPGGAEEYDRRRDLLIFFERLEAELKEAGWIIFANSLRDHKRCWGIVRHAPALHFLQQPESGWEGCSHQPYYQLLFQELGTEIFGGCYAVSRHQSTMEIFWYERPKVGDGLRSCQTLLERMIARLRQLPEEKAKLLDGLWEFNLREVELS